MTKNWIALLLVLCMLSTLGIASACCTDGCCISSGMTETQTMEETCPCMMDGKGVNGCPCMGDACGEDCMCMDGKSCTMDGMTADDCACEKQCACGDGCACAELMPEGDAAAANMAEDKTMCTADCDCMGEETCMSDGMCSDACMCESEAALMFPTFEGMDLDGNSVTSEMFKDNAVTVVNFCFSSCAPCIAELGELNALNETLKEKGGEVIGINADTIGGNEKMIMEAKEILEKQGAMYRNIYFPVESAAGQLTYSIMAFPTTVVVDRSGNIVGNAILGGINYEAQMNELQSIIDEVLMKDMEMMKAK